VSNLAQNDFVNDDTMFEQSGDVEHVQRYDMALLEYRIHANYRGAGWRWEVATHRALIARGIAVTHAQARTDMMRAVASTPGRETDPVCATSAHLALVPLAALVREGGHIHERMCSKHRNRLLKVRDRCQASISWLAERKDQLTYRTKNTICARPFLSTCSSCGQLGPGKLHYSQTLIRG
jgi:hypothetical protein